MEKKIYLQPQILLVGMSASPVLAGSGGPKIQNQWKVDGASDDAGGGTFNIYEEGTGTGQKEINDDDIG